MTACLNLLLKKETNMKQSYHSNAKTNLHIRSQIYNSKTADTKLAELFGISLKTVQKWKKRACPQDLSSKPNTIHYSLNELEKALVIHIRKNTWSPLDEVVEMIFPDNPKTYRSCVYRTFVSEAINKVPEKEKIKAKRFKEYEPGYLHMDVTYFPKFDGTKHYLFVAIDRATRLLYYRLYTEKTATNAEDFMKRCLEFFPFGITHVLTDNGLEFTNKLIKSKKGKYCIKPSKLDTICEENNIKHRLTKPSTPKTNGMVEKVNDTIKKGTIKRTTYKSYSEMEEDTIRFFVFYNMYRRHGSLRKELNVKTPFDAVEKWYELNPKLFKESPLNFKKKLINLKQEKASCLEQPCET